MSEFYRDLSGRTVLKSNYEMQLTNLNDKLQSFQQISDHQLQLANAQLDEVKVQLSKKSSVPLLVWLLIVLLAVAAGIFIGMFFIR